MPVPTLAEILSSASSDSRWLCNKCVPPEQLEIKQCGLRYRFQPMISHNIALKGIVSSVDNGQLTQRELARHKETRHGHRYKGLLCWRVV